jgi:pSer/pThr/pTyr-binding forkhead associated (FHA) protein
LLKSRSDLDPGGECKGVLAQLIGRIPHLPPRSLRNRDTGRTFALSFRTTVGRSADCALRLESRQVSGHHAVIRWHDAAWHLRDLGSGNGTWLNGVHIEPGRSHRIDVGDSIRFADDEWRVVDATSPSGSEVH